MVFIEDRIQILAWLKRTDVSLFINLNTDRFEQMLRSCKWSISTERALGVQKNKNILVEINENPLKDESYRVFLVELFLREDTLISRDVLMSHLLQFVRSHKSQVMAFLKELREQKIKFIEDKTLPTRVNVENNLHQLSDWLEFFSDKAFRDLKKIYSSEMIIYLLHRYNLQTSKLAKEIIFDEIMEIIKDELSTEGSFSLNNVRPYYLHVFWKEIGAYRNRPSVKPLVAFMQNEWKNTEFLTRMKDGAFSNMLTMYFHLEPNIISLHGLNRSKLLDVLIGGSKIKLFDDLNRLFMDVVYFYSFSDKKKLLQAFNALDITIADNHNIILILSKYYKLAFEQNELDSDLLDFLLVHAINEAEFRQRLILDLNHYDAPTRVKIVKALSSPFPLIQAEKVLIESKLTTDDLAQLKYLDLKSKRKEFKNLVIEDMIYAMKNVPRLTNLMQMIDSLNRKLDLRDRSILDSEISQRLILRASYLDGDRDFILKSNPTFFLDPQMERNKISLIQMINVDRAKRKRAPLSMRDIANARWSADYIYQILILHLKYDLSDSELKYFLFDDESSVTYFKKLRDFIFEYHKDGNALSELDLKIIENELRSLHLHPHHLDFDVYIHFMMQMFSFVGRGYVDRDVATQFLLKSLNLGLENQVVDEFLENNLIDADLILKHPKLYQYKLELIDYLFGEKKNSPILPKWVRALMISHLNLEDVNHAPEVLSKIAILMSDFKTKQIQNNSLLKLIFDQTFKSKTRLHPRLVESLKMDNDWRAKALLELQAQLTKTILSWNVLSETEKIKTMRWINWLGVLLEVSEYEWARINRNIVFSSDEQKTSFINWKNSFLKQQTERGQKHFLESIYPSQNNEARMSIASKKCLELLSKFNLEFK